jgi:RNA polymerase sigma-70 factor (ECF subfamily)
MESHADPRESEDLIRSMLAGNERAFDELVGLHKRFVFNLGDYDEADDCAQEVFIKVHKSIGGFRFESDFKTWLYRIAVNTCKNRFRSVDYKRAQKDIRLDAQDEEDRMTVEIGTHKQSPALALKRKEIGRLIQAAVNRLPADQRLVVVLRDMEGRTYEEIIEITGLKLGTLKSKLSRARLRLRESLKGAI